MKMKIFRSNVDSLLFLLLCMTLGGLIVMLYFGFSNGYECLQQPLTYGVEKLNELNDVSLLCSCNAQEGGYNALLFDSNGFIPSNISYSVYSGYLNTSILNFSG